MPHLDPGQILIAFTLLLAANGAPIIARRLLGDRYAAPVDSGRYWRDGRRILGTTKTWRGVLCSIALTACVGAVFGLSPALGAGFAALSMSGDLLSSFLKRRAGLHSSHIAFGLDQIPEALLPTFLLSAALGLSVSEVAVVVLGFLLLGSWLSKILYRMRIRKEPM